MHAMRDPITDSASMFDVPPELVAGVEYNEFGGADAVKPSVYSVRSMISQEWGDRTSLGPAAMQVRRAAETLGYDPANLTDEQRSAIVASLQDPAQATYIVAAHLRQLIDVDNPGIAANQLTRQDLIRAGARYNYGPERPLALLDRDLSYGVAIANRWDKLTYYLTDDAKVPDTGWRTIERHIEAPVNDELRKLGNDAIEYIKPRPWRMP